MGCSILPILWEVYVPLARRPEENGTTILRDEEKRRRLQGYVSYFKAFPNFDKAKIQHYEVILANVR